MRAQFILSEIGIGLRRNLTMTVAVIVTIAISLALFGFGPAHQQAGRGMKDFWYDKVEVSVFLCGAGHSEAASCAAARSRRSSASRSARPRRHARGRGGLLRVQAEAYERFKEQFKDSAIVDNVTADQMPESFRVKLKDPEQFDVVASAFPGRPGVEQVQDQKELLEKFFKVLN